MEGLYGKEHPARHTLLRNTSLGTNNSIPRRPCETGALTALGGLPEGI